MYKCICGNDKTGKIDDDKVGLALGGILHVILAVVLSIGFGLGIGLLYLSIVAIILLGISAYFATQGHTLRCSLRRASIDVLIVGTFISPY